MKFIHADSFYNKSLRLLDCGIKSDNFKLLFFFGKAEKAGMLVAIYICKTKI